MQAKFLCGRWLPQVERRFRGLGEGWARFVHGCSTGGWESLAVQVEIGRERCCAVLPFTHFIPGSRTD
jgi:hypothetical protein